MLFINKWRENIFKITIFGVKIVEVLYKGFDVTSAHVLLNLLKLLRKSDKMLDKPRNFIAFSQRL